MKGKVKFFNNGFGFIKVRDGEDVHFDLRSFDGPSPQKDDIVEFDVIEEPKGPHAINLRIISNSSNAKISTGNSHSPKLDKIKDHFFLPKDTADLLLKHAISEKSLELFKQSKNLRNFEFDKLKKKLRNVIGRKFEQPNDLQKAISQSVDQEFANDIDELVGCKELLPSDEIQNFSLHLNKIPYFDTSPNIYKFDFTNGNGKLRFDSDTVLKKANPEDYAAKYKERLQLLPLNIAISPVQLHPEFRMIIGLGTSTVYDTSMTLHHIYGFPYIPGQAVKGVLRSYIINEFFNSVEKDAYMDKLFCDIFGCPKESMYKEARQGNIYFFDILPQNTPCIEVDIMNPHYRDYYNDEGDTPPADYLSPSPVNFLTVGKDTKFEFILGIRKKVSQKLKEYESSTLASNIKGEKYCLDDEANLLKVSEVLLHKALTTHGIGAKTAVGYGYFKE